MVATTTWFGLGALAMGAAAAGVAGALAIDRRGRPYHAILLAVMLVGTLDYALLSLGVGTVVVGGAPLPLLRYLDWLVTVPLLVLYLALVAGTDQSTLWTAVGLALAFVGLGLVGAVVPGAVPAGVVYLLAVAAFAGMAYLLSGPMQADANAGDDRVRALFEKLRNLAVVLLAVYPVVWILGPGGAGLLLPGTEALVVAYLDTLTRVGFAVIALANRGALASLGDDAFDVITGPSA